MDQIINLDRNDDVFRIHSQVEWANGRRVIVVVPRGARAISSEHDVHLVHRWADDADVQVAFISDDYYLRERAAAGGVPVFSAVGKAQRARWKWKRDGVGITPRATALDDGAPVAKKPILDRLGLAGIQFVITLALFVAAAAVLGVAAMFLAPAAHITVYPAALTVNDSREVILDPTINTIDQINNLIPASPFRSEISGTATIKTTKVDTAPADHATGQAIFTNLAGPKITIPAGTVVETSSGVTVRFTTTVPAELPAGYNVRVTVPIRAIDAGPVGNVKGLQINTIEGSLGSVARVINTAPTGGGTIKQVHLVSFDDKTRLRDLLASQLQAAAVGRIQKAAGGDVFVAPASVDVSVVTESFDHLVDDPSDTLSLHVEAVATGMAVDHADLEKFAQGVLVSKVPKGYALLPNTLKVTTDPNARVEGSAVIFTMHSSLQMTPQVKASDLLKGLAGKTPAEATDIIGQRVSLAGPPAIRISPSWWPRLPWWDMRLDLSVESQLPDQQQGTSGSNNP
ncbi:MAG: baseplate J/gp47 family protein [Anaerolineae bacterium]